MNSFDNKENDMEQEKTKQESGRFFEQRKLHRHRSQVKVGRYRDWLKSNLCD